MKKSMFILLALFLVVINARQVLSKKANTNNDNLTDTTEYTNTEELLIKYSFLPNLQTKRIIALCIEQFSEKKKTILTE